MNELVVCFSVRLGHCIYGRSKFERREGCERHHSLVSIHCYSFPPLPQTDRPLPSPSPAASPEPRGRVPPLCSRRSSFLATLAPSPGLPNGVSAGLPALLLFSCRCCHCVLSARRRAHWQLLRSQAAGSSPEASPGFPLSAVSSFIVLLAGHRGGSLGPTLCTSALLNHKTRSRRR
ncbi:hypothetical protein BS78_10G177600 [Paspalum vaginatum]|nr:hypothetical protein BS78_10G177600 [Paspalum vaginatum]